MRSFQGEFLFFCMDLLRFGHARIPVVKEGGMVYFNAKEMARPFGKRPNDYILLKSTQRLIKGLEGHVDGDLVNTTRGGLYPEDSGTWMSLMLFVDFAKWLSFDLWVFTMYSMDSLLSASMYEGVGRAISPFDVVDDDTVYTYIAYDSVGRYKFGKTVSLEDRESAGRTTNLDFKILYYVDRDIERHLLDTYVDRKIDKDREWVEMSMEEIEEIVNLYGFERL